MSYSRPIRLAVLLLLGTACIPSRTSLASNDFYFGAWNPYNNGANAMNLDWYDSAGFNAYSGIVSPPYASAETGINIYAARGWRVIASNTEAHTGYDFGHAHFQVKQSNLIHFEAEAIGSTQLVYGPTTCLCHQGSVDGEYWYVDPANPSHIPNVPAWEIRQHYQVYPKQYTAVFYLKIDSIKNVNDIVAKIEIWDTIPPPDGPYKYPVDSLFVRASDFSGANEITAIEVPYFFTWPGNPTRKGLLNGIFRLIWYGNRKLSMDSVVLFDVPAKTLIRDVLSAPRDSVVAQADRYKTTYVQDTLLPHNTPALRAWLGNENNWNITQEVLIDKMEPAQWMDSLLEAAGRNQGFVWDRNLIIPHKYDGEDEKWFSLQPRHFIFWPWPFVLNSVPTAYDDLDSIQVYYDSLLVALDHSRSRAAEHGTELHYVVHANAPSWDSVDVNPSPDTVQWALVGDSLRPTYQELKAMSFLGFCYDIDALWYWPLGQSSTSTNLYLGLILGGTTATQRRTPKYWAVANDIGPFVNRFANMLDTLEWQVAGLASSDPIGVISNVQSLNLEDNYVQTGQYRGVGEAADYVLLVNRNTSDSGTVRQLVFDIATDQLQASPDFHYYIIDMNPTYSGTTMDTTLAGPLNGTLRYYTTIESGGAKLIKIVSAPDRVAGTSFPQKWWGAIQADEGITLSSNRSLAIASGSRVNIHTDCGYNEEYNARFNVNGSLKALGKSDSQIVFDKVYDGPPHGIECESEGDHGLWGGLDFEGTAACTLTYCNIRNAAIPAKSFLQPLVMDHVTTTNSVGPTCYLYGSGQQFKLTNCVFDGAVQTFGGKVTLDYCRIDGAPIGIEAKPTGQYSDTVLVKHSVIVNSDSIGIYANGYPVSLRSCTLSVADIGIKARAAVAYFDTVKVLNCGQAVLIDTNATLAGQKLHVVSSGIGLNVRKGWGLIGASTFSGLDTVVYADPASGQTLQLSHLTATYQCKKGIVARSGILKLDTCIVFSDSLTAIDAYTGSTVVRITSGGAKGPASSAAAVSIGPTSRLVASNAGFSDSWIGVELRRNGADTIKNCLFMDNTLYGIWCDSGTTADLLSGNYIVNDTASALNFGVNVLLQPIKSVNDTIMGVTGHPNPAT